MTNLLEPNNDSLGDFLEQNPEFTRRQYRVRWIGENAQTGSEGGFNFPGTFGWLESTNGPGAKELREQMARDDLDNCVFLDQASLAEVENGQTEGAMSGLTPASTSTRER